MRGTSNLVAMLCCALLISWGCSNPTTGDDASGGADTSATDTAADVGDDIGVDATESDTGSDDDTAADAIGDSADPTDGTEGDGGADDTAVADTAADVPDTAKPDIDESKGLASDELLVKVLGPSGREWVQSDSEFAQLSGVLFGEADTIEWSSSNGKSDTISLAAWWVSGVIELSPGDNAITVTAKKGTQVATDTVHIVYNPFFTFEGAPQIAPDVLFVGESATMVVRMPLSGAGSGPSGKGPVDPSTVKLIECDADGKKIQDTKKLVDDGSASNCDDIQKDGYYSACLSMTPNVAKRLYFRVEATVTVLDKTYTALSPMTQVDVVQRMQQSECNQIVGLQKKVKGDVLAAVGGGKSAADAAADGLSALKADATVAEAGIAKDGTTIWVRYKSGRLGAIQLPTPGQRSAGASPAPGVSTAALPTYSVGTRRAVAIAPNSAEFQAGFPSGQGDEAAWAGQGLADRECPPFSVDTATGDKALLSYYRNIWQYGVVAITGHGTTLFGGMEVASAQAYGWEHTGSQEVLFSGEAVNCSALASSAKSCSSDASCPAGQECVKTSKSSGICVDQTQGDIMSGRVVIGDATYGTTPAFFQRHMRQDLPASIVYLGGCRTLNNGSVAVQLFGAGAAAVVGYSGDVTNAFAWSHGFAFFDKLINHQGSVLQAVTLLDVDPETGGSMRWIGNGKSNANDGALINASWDAGKATGWKAVGDGRVISRLGVTVPVAGKFMGIISTGLGFTAQSGSLEQPFCVAPGATELCYYWKFYSEEFVEFCGSSYMDRLTAVISGKQGKLTITDVFIDPLCPYDCGGKSPCTPGSPSCKCGSQWKTLDPADVSFDQGDVHMTPWIKDCKDISPFAGKRADLKFFVTDTGDSIYDTAVLIDEVTIQ